MVCTPQSNDEIIGRIQGPKDLFDHVQIDPASLKLPHIIRYDSKTQLLTKLVWFLHSLLELGTTRPKKSSSNRQLRGRLDL